MNQFQLNREDLSLLVEDKTRSSFIIVDSAGIKDQGIVWRLRVQSEILYAKNHCQQITATLSLFIKFESFIGHGESTSAVRFFLRVHIK